MTKTSGKEKRGNPMATPEELSKRISIVDTKGRIAVGAGIVLAVVLMVWSILGSVPEMVAGSGILVPPDGLLRVVSLGQGQVTEVDIDPGDTVTAGDIMARVSMPELEAERQSVLASLKNAKLWTEERTSYYEQTIDVQGKNNEERVAHLHFRMQYLQEYFNFLQKHVKDLDKMQRGYITPKEVEDTRKNMQAVLAEINDCKLRIAEVQAAELDLASKVEQDRLHSLERESDLELALESVEHRLNLFSKVRSPYSGVVVEADIQRGDYVSPGMPMFTLRPLDAPLEASLLFPVETGKKIKPGMVAYVYPSTASKEEYGCIYGLVTSVSEYPVSSAGLKTSIGTEHLIATLMEQGVMLEARIALLRAPETPSGFKWSSSTGPKAGVIEEGTVCTGNVVLERSRPIDLVFPKFSKMVGLSAP